MTWTELLFLYSFILMFVAVSLFFQNRRTIRRLGLRTRGNRSNRPNTLVTPDTPPPAPPSDPPERAATMVRMELPNDSAAAFMQAVLRRPGRGRRRNTKAHRVTGVVQDSKEPGVVMGYMKVPNLYKDQTILLFKECYALEKVHGTSARVRWNAGLTFSSGGSSHTLFRSIFDEETLAAAFHESFGATEVVVFGEAYGGKQQRMKATYGPELCFIAFEVQIDGFWLAVPQAHDVVTKLGLEFVPYNKVSTDLACLDAERDRPSQVAQRRGMGDDKKSEGVVLRPLVELTGNNGCRVISKHKNDDFRETATPRVVDDPEKLAQLSAANDIAIEWVTAMRLEHVLDKLEGTLGVERTGEVVKAMTNDVIVEAGDEIIDSKAARKAIGKRASQAFLQHLKDKLKDSK